MVEAQEYPDDYDGIWASSPAINWTKFLIAGFWPIAAANECYSDNCILLVAAIHAP